MHASAATKLEILSARPMVSGHRVGRITAISPAGVPCVDFPGNPHGPRQARRVRSLAPEVLARAREDGDAVLLAFEDNDPLRPIIVDVLADAPRVRRQGHPADDAAASLPAPVSLPAGAGVQEAGILGVESGFVVVELPDRPGERVPVRTAVPLRNLHDPVLLVRTDHGAAVIIGQLLPSPVLEGEGDENADLVLAGNHVRIDAHASLVLRAGRCSVTLDAKGRATVLADHIVSRATATHKVQGGSIQLN